VERNVSPALLEEIVLKGKGPDVGRMEALWTRLSLGSPSEPFLLALMEHDNPSYRAWGARTAGDARMNSQPIADRLAALARDPHPDVRLQVAIAAGKIPLIDSVSILLDVLSASAGDESGLTARIVWQNLHPLLPAKNSSVIAWLGARSAEEHTSLAAIAERLVGRLISTEPGESEELHRLFDLLLLEEKVAPVLTGRFLEPLLDASITGELVEHRFNLSRSRFEGKLLKRALSDQDEKSLSPEEGFAVLLGNETARERAATILVDAKAAPEERLDALQALVKANPQTVVDSLDSLLNAADPAFASELLPALAKLHHTQIANAVLASYANLPASVRPQALDLLTSRSQWAEALIAAVESKSLAASDVNANQLRKMMHLAKGQLRPRVENTFGKVREDRDRGREQVISRVQRMLTMEPGDPAKGKAVFTKVCAQCHKLNGEGNDVGPDLTSNGRSSLDQLLSNLLDPNLVIGKDYQARVVATADGRILTGLVTEDSEGRVVLKIAGGKLEVIPKGEIEEMRDSAISLMPEKLETQISDPELRDLIAYLMSIEVKQ
jgi:putative heme-binding domain-containing protein